MNRESWPFAPLVRVRVKSDGRRGVVVGVGLAQNPELGPCMVRVCLDGGGIFECGAAAIEPWKPTAGDWVRVRSTGAAGQITAWPNSEGCGVFAGFGLTGPYKLDDLEPCEPPKPSARRTIRFPAIGQLVKVDEPTSIWHGRTGMSTSFHIGNVTLVNVAFSSEGRGARQGAMSFEPECVTPVGPEPHRWITIELPEQEPHGPCP